MLDFEAFASTLPIMAKGMLGIFIITVIFIALIALLNKLFPAKKEKPRQ